MSMRKGGNACDSVATMISYLDSGDYRFRRATQMVVGWQFHPTPWAKEVNPDKTWPEYRKPLMTRALWQNLDGLWDYAIIAVCAEAASSFADGCFA